MGIPGIKTLELLEWQGVVCWETRWDKKTWMARRCGKAKFNEANALAHGQGATKGGSLNCGGGRNMQRGKKRVSVMSE